MFKNKNQIRLDHFINIASLRKLPAIAKANITISLSSSCTFNSNVNLPISLGKKYYLQSGEIGKAGQG